MLIESLIPPKILIIDDDYDYDIQIKNILEETGFEVDIAQNQDEVKFLMNQDRYSLIFIDLLGTTTEGFNILRRIKDNPKFRRIPAIFITNLGDMEYINAGLSIGASDYVIKSHFKPKDILKYTKKYLISFNARQNLQMN